MHLPAMTSFATTSRMAGSTTPTTSGRPKSSPISWLREFLAGSVVPSHPNLANPPSYKSGRISPSAGHSIIVVTSILTRNHHKKRELRLFTARSRLETPFCSLSKARSRKSSSSLYGSAFGVSLPYLTLSGLEPSFGVVIGRSPTAVLVIELTSGPRFSSIVFTSARVGEYIESSARSGSGR